MCIVFVSHLSILADNYKKPRILSLEYFNFTSTVEAFSPNPTLRIEVFSLPLFLIYQILFNSSKLSVKRIFLFLDAGEK